ncbi:Ldh family oxidoreductase [Mycobacterium deserti]|uniref:Ldh family oxidoreductase n=1 Tax=Mycobacterium deserti TaxID=2978347 RepID=A0ABT2MGM8_9MYCO|nr:Ldh family oxidoreductase [Mycobacterium deserti]MCT7661136.1 Ldh family oxidoreductase [Mycobacterium deserti]
MTTRRFVPDSLRDQIVRILIQWGMAAPIADTTATVMVDADLSGIDSHGVSMLLMYETLLNEGRLNANAVPAIAEEGPAFGVVDGDHGLGHATAVYAVELAIAKAAYAGIGAVAVRNSRHFGAAGYYARLASERGCIALITTSTRIPVTFAAGGTSPVLGTNPIAFAAPRADGEPLVVDISTSVVAMNKVKAYALKGDVLPVGWVYDRTGRPVTDSAAAYAMLTSQEATLSPLGGAALETGAHKGFGLSLMVQILSTALSNAATPLDTRDRDNIGHFFLVIDTAMVNSSGSVAGIVEDTLTAMQRDEQEVRIPGDPEREARSERGRRGIPLPDTLIRQVADIAARSGAPFVLTESS